MKFPKKVNIMQLKQKSREPSVVLQELAKQIDGATLYIKHDPHPLIEDVRKMQAGDLAEFITGIQTDREEIERLLNKEVPAKEFKLGTVKGGRITGGKNGEIELQITLRR